MSSPCTIMSSNKAIVFDPSLIQTRPTFSKEFIWPTGYNLNNQSETNDDHIGGHVLNEPLIDLEGFFMGDEEAITRAADLINKACVTHGLFQVTNHRVDPELIGSAHDQLEGLFELPLEKKQRVQRKAGELWGYSGAHTDRFSKELPWKETFSFGYPFLHERITGSGYKPVVVDYFISAFGQEFEHAGWVYQKYCEAMKEVSLVIFELLAISLGVERQHFREFYEDGNSIMRCNSYPPCNEPSLTFGTGPHCDPTSLTILHQDQVGGLQVFADNKWQSVRPRPDALVINIGDTLMALCNGRYKSCLHRALVNKYRVRRSLAFFVNPTDDKVVRPPHRLITQDQDQATSINGCCTSMRRLYPDFKWPHLLEFTQKHHRADVTTLQCFFQWLPSSNCV